MQQLPNNCRMGKMSVHPKNWQNKNVSVKQYWRISYWFYDDNLQRKKQVWIQGMNHLTCLSDRQNLTKILIENELKNLQSGFNPVVGKFIVSSTLENPTIVNQNTLFCDALRKALSTLNLEGFTKDNMILIVEKICVNANDFFVDNSKMN